MSKALEALEELRKQCNDTFFDENGKQWWITDKSKDYKCNIIEKELQRLESIDNSNPSEALECLFRIGYNHRENYINGRHKEDYNIVEQTLLKAQEQEKVLVIIKEKNVDIFWLKNSKTKSDYNSHVFISKINELTEEEFELLKRYFENE